MINGTARRRGRCVDGQDERKLLKSIVDFGDTLVREVMTPRPDIVAIPADATLDDLRALFREQEYSRIPVFRDNLDNILGFVYVKDLILLGDSLQGDAPITNHLRPAHFVPETKLVSELLREFQQQRIQSAIVVDEYGGTAGLVTLEDSSKKSSARFATSTTSRPSRSSKRGTGRSSSAERRTSTKSRNGCTCRSSAKGSRRSAASC